MCVHMHYACSVSACMEVYEQKKILSVNLSQTHKDIRCQKTMQDEYPQIPSTAFHPFSCPFSFLLPFLPL